jgi:hypothetical protein
MNGWPITCRRLAGALAAAATVAALSVSTALADPPNHARYLPTAHVSSYHQPEILGGLTASPEGRPLSSPEIIDGVTSSAPLRVTASGRRSTPVASGFDWADAGIGAAVALAVGALGAAGALTLRKRVSPAH